MWNLNASTFVNQTMIGALLWNLFVDRNWPKKNSVPTQILTVVYNGHSIVLLQKMENSANVTTRVVGNGTERT